MSHSPSGPDADAELIRRLDRIEADVFADVFDACPAPLAQGLGLRVVRHDGGAVSLVAPQLPTSFFNRTLCLGNDRPATEADVAAVVDAHASSGVAEYWVHVGPAARPAELGALLEARGLSIAQRRSWAKVHRGPGDVPHVASELRVVEIGADQASAFARVVLAAFGMPPPMAPWIEALVERPHNRCYVAFDGDTPVSAGLVHLAGDAAWLGMGSTLATHRGRGGQGALMERRIVDALASGATLIATETGEPVGDEKNPSLANMFRMGFRTAASRLNYGWRRG